MDLLVGAVAFLVIFAITSLFRLPILYTIMTNLANVAVIAVLVIFQPEVRIALSKLSLKGKKYREVTEFDRFLDQLTNSVFRLAEKQIGALIVLEREDNLDEFSQKGVIVNGKFSAELLETIFASSTPLHDGAVMIRDKTIVAAAVILPLSDESPQIPRLAGTRHRAALGISQITDACAIAVSESGRVSLAREGIITGSVKPDRFKGIIRSIFTSPEAPPLRSKFNLKNWLKT